MSPLASGVLQIFVMGDFRGFAITVISYPFALTLGIPAFFIARYLGWLSLKAVLLGGAGLGVLAGLLITLDGLHGRPVSIILGFGLLAAHGAVVAGIFWFIAFWRSGAPVSSTSLQHKESS
ncbi:hypothetical protein WH297_14660 [Ochrobactrum vermis]|uniref:Major facilitator superfamily (MFS) profile domain-containing protein n=1 Tax=Ochrobactrum vermis TaxID=1827297 RepID=A0ABU8PH95_9HYPH|nr:hypothetical protein [Ochrobactrum vermis]